MLLKRTITILILLPIGLVITFLGGVYFTLFVGLVLGLAGWEFSHLFSSGKYQPSTLLIILFTIVLVFTAGLSLNIDLHLLVSLLILLSFTYHIISYERGVQTAATDLAITITGWLYLGWIGSYLVTLRGLPGGEWWFLVVLPAVWFADTIAYMIGFVVKTHPVGLRTSPNKSWEGFLVSYIAGPVGGMLAALLWSIWGSPVTLWQGAVLGFVLSILTPLGDLGISLIKRQFNAKDSGNLLPGHGGVLDRIDSWLWAGVIGYYLITWWFI